MDVRGGLPLVFLDIQMPDLSGFDALRQLDDEELPYVAFVTAYDEHALEAFQVNALAYLLKPFDDIRLSEVLDRCRSFFRNRSPASLPDPDLVEFRDVTVLDGTGRPPLLDMTVVVRDGRIDVVGEARDVEVPAGATVVEGRARFLMSGLIDLHVHLSKARRSALPLFVSHGVTTVRDLGGEWEEVRSWREEGRRGVLVSPRIRSSGPYLDMPSNVERMREARARGEMMEPVGAPGSPWARRSGPVRWWTRWHGWAST